MLGEAMTNDLPETTFTYSAAFVSFQNGKNETQFVQHFLFSSQHVTHCFFAYLLFLTQRGAVTMTILTVPWYRTHSNGAQKKLLVAAWVSPGRSALQSAEHWCQRRYNQIDLVMMFIIKMKQKRATRGHWNNKSNKTKQRSSQHCDFVAQVVKKRAPVKSFRKAPTPEW